LSDSFVSLIALQQPAHSDLKAHIPSVAAHEASVFLLSPEQSKPACLPASVGWQQLESAGASTVDLVTVGVDVGVTPLVVGADVACGVGLGVGLGVGGEVGDEVGLPSQPIDIVVQHHFCL
jgi:hypothetical protein